MSINSKNIFSNLKHDIPASIVVFLVAMPLCLGIALASDAPPLSGLIAGIIGGIVVGSLSGSSLGVSGPAAGLAIIVAGAIADLGGFDIFLAAVVISGVIQVIMGFIKAGNIAYFFPSSVVYGMLSGIGIIISLKQIPHAFGLDKDPEGDWAFLQSDGENTFSEILNILDFSKPGVMIITAVALAILLLWERDFIKNNKILSIIPGPLLAVSGGIFLNYLFQSNPDLAVTGSHLVELPISNSAEEFLGNFKFPKWDAFFDYNVYLTALLIAVVASLETLIKC